MKIIQKSKLLLAIMAFAVTSNLSSAEGYKWLIDFEEAKKKAQKEGKSIFMNFTGSDYCLPCKALDANVFSKEIFQTEMSKHVIFLKLDSPADTSKQSQKEIEQNRKLVEEFSVAGPPTLFLADAKGKPYWKTIGYAQQTAEDYTGNLKKKVSILQVRNSALAKAEKADGLAKAKLLAEGLNHIHEDLLFTFYKPQVDELLKLDKTEDKSISAKYLALKRAPQIAEKLQEILLKEAPAEELLKLLDGLIEEEKPVGIVLQEALYWKGAALFQSGKKEAARKIFEDIVKAGPDTMVGMKANMVIKQVLPR